MAMSTAITRQKITVNLVERAVEALDASTQREGKTRTEVINHALQVYDWIGREVARGSEVGVKPPGKDLYVTVRFV